MQNMIRVGDSAVGVIHVFFDIKDGEITNISAKDNGIPADPATFDVDRLRELLAREYIASTLEMAMLYRQNDVPLMC